MSLPLSRTLVWLMTGVTSMEEEVRLWLAPRTHTHLPLVQFIFPLCFFSLSRCWRGTSSSVRVRFGFGSGSVRSVFCLLFPSQHTPFCISCFLFSLCTLHFYFSTGVSGWFFSLDRPAALAVGLAIGRGDSWGWVGVIYSGSGRPPGGGGGRHTRGRDTVGFLLFGFWRGMQHGSGLARDFWFPSLDGWPGGEHWEGPVLLQISGGRKRDW